MTETVLVAILAFGTVLVSAGGLLFCAAVVSVGPRHIAGLVAESVARNLRGE